MTNSFCSKRKKWLSFLFELLLLAMAVSDCLAQQSVPDLAEASLEQLGNIKVYSASKHLQSPKDAPSSVPVITADEIQKYGYRTLADILQNVRGFFVTNDRNYSSVGVRGFARPGDFNTRVLLLVDGHRLNDNVYDEAMIGTEFPVDVDLIRDHPWPGFFALRQQRPFCGRQHHHQAWSRLSRIGTFG